MGTPLSQLIRYDQKTKTFRVLFTAANWFGQFLVNFKIYFDLVGESFTKMLWLAVYAYAVVVSVAALIF